MKASNRIAVSFNAANAFHVGDNAFTVELCIGGGKFAYHVGPGAFPYFTQEQAEALAHKVSMAGSIDPAQWTDGYLRPLTANMVAPRPVLQFA